MAHRKWLMIVTCMAALAITGACKRQSATQEALPATGDVGGWTRTSEVRSFTADNLYKYVDGDVERYLKAGVKSAETADYKYQGRLEATADVYTMAGSDGAAKIFTSEPAGSAKTADVGEAARLDSQSLIFRKGRHFVRIVAFQESAEGQSALLALGREIARRLAD